MGTLDGKSDLVKSLLVPRNTQAVNQCCPAWGWGREWEAQELPEVSPPSVCAEG